MIKLNIISPKLKNEIKFKFFYHTLRGIFYILLISILTHTTLLVTAKYILRAHSNETNNRNILATSQTEDYDKKVKDINSQVDYIGAIQNDTVTWSKFIEILSKNINSGIYVSQVSVNQKSEAFSITGFAETRENLLTFKESLEELGYFDTISIPIDILLQKENISFSINTRFTSYEFK